MVHSYWLLLVQIVCESVPVSSSGHVFLAAMIIEKWCGKILADRAGIDSLLDASHLITIFLLGILFFDELMSYARNFLRVWPFAFSTILFVGAADLVTCFWYVVFKKIYMPPIPLWVGFCATGIILLSTFFARVGRKKWGMGAAVVLGMAQGIALLPGVSRLATVYAVACFMGANRQRAFKLAWALAVPLMAAAGLVALRSEETRAQIVLIGSSPSCVMGLLAACVVSYLLLTASYWLARHNRLWVFGGYMIGAAIIAALL